MHLMFSYHQAFRYWNLSIQVIVYLAFLLGVYFCLISWGEKFKSSFSEKAKIKAEKGINNFNLSIPDFQISWLYYEMARFDLIDQEKTSITDFRNALLQEWNSHNSKIHLNMDGPTCREFFDHLVKTFPNNSMTLKNLFITSGLVFRPDGKKYNYNTLKNAPTRSPISKMHATLTSIFKKLD